MEAQNAVTGEIVDITNVRSLDKISMKELTASSINPFMVPREIKLRRRTRHIATVRSNEVALVSVHNDGVTMVINQTIEQDEAHFVKLFRGCLVESFDLTTTGRKVLDLVLKATEEGAVGADIIYFNFMEAEQGKPDGISRQTWLRGTKELYFKGFIAPVLNKPNLFFINPHLFFKGDRVDLITRFVKANADRLVSGSVLEQAGQWTLVT